MIGCLKTVTGNRRQHGTVNVAQGNLKESTFKPINNQFTTCPATSLFFEEERVSFDENFIIK